MSVHTDANFPSQKKSRAQKTKDWRKRCVNGAEQLALFADDGVRASYRNKQINYDLYSDILDQDDVEKICNPMHTPGMSMPAKMQNYPICNPKIDLLVGESIGRKFDWKIRVVNDDAISEKEEELLGRFQGLMTSHISEEMSEEEVKKDLAKFQQWADFEYQDHRERTSTQILEYLYKHLRLHHTFSKGFKDALICAEEVYQTDIIAGEPVLVKRNPKNVHTVRAGESNKIEDSDIITLVSYMSPGQVIDKYHEFLSPTEVARIENGMTNGESETNNGKGIHIGNRPDLPISGSNEDGILISSLANNVGYGSQFDDSGNIRVTENYWKSLRKVKKVKYYDEQGDEQYDIFDETYKINVDAGEEETILWISEWWEGTKIGGDIGEGSDSAIYIKMRPRPIQFRSMENPSKCHPGVVGTIYNTNDNLGVSLMDRMKPYQYLYNVLAYNTEVAISKNYGKIMRIDLASIPENWKVDKWMSFAQGMNAAFYDSFKEGNKGAAQGKLAGTMNQNSPVIDMEMGNTIQLYLGMMDFIKRELGEIAGVSASRQGQVQSRQAVGNTQTEMQQSSHITEYWFLEHEETKLRAMQILLETAKYAWKDKHNKKVQHVLDDGSTAMFSVDMEQFNEGEYGLQMSNGRDSYELIQTMKQLAHAGLQTGAVNFSQLLDIYSTSSTASIRRKMERSEREKMEREQKEQERKQEMAREQSIVMSKEAEKARDFQREEWDRKDAIEEMKAQTQKDIERMRQDNEDSRYYDESAVGGDSGNELKKLQQEADKIRKEFEIKNKQHAETVRANKANEEIKRKQVNKKPTGK
jgi:hypothetical protein